VALVEGETDLGVLRPLPGSSIRLHVRVPEGQDAPRVGLFATRVGEPSYHRGLNSQGETEVVLRGLGPGRFRVTAAPVMAMGGARLVETVDCDGASEVVLTLDLAR
jgi:hypothetical protein